MRQLVFFFSILFLSACGSNAIDNGENPYSRYEDDKMVGTVRDVKTSENSIDIDISDWEKRDRKGPNITSEGYSYIAKITEETVFTNEDGTEASIDDIKKGQKVLVMPPRGNEFEGYPDEIVLVEMTYEEKYARLLAPLDGFNIAVMYENGEQLPVEMQVQMYEKVLSILGDKDLQVASAWMEYDKDYVVDYKDELGIETFPVILVFDKEKLVYKTNNVGELYDYFRK